MYMPHTCLQQSNYRPDGQKGHGCRLTDCVGCQIPPGSTANKLGYKRQHSNLKEYTVVSEFLYFLQRSVFAKRNRKVALIELIDTNRH